MSDVPRSWPAPPGQWPGAPPQNAEPPLKSRWLKPVLLLGGVLFVVALGFASWGGVKIFHAFQQAGQQEITQLHTRMKAQQFDAIYDGADAAYRTSVSRERSNELFQVVHDHMGDPLNYTVVNVSKNTNSTVGTTKTIILSTHFSKGDGQETLQFHSANGKWLLYGYYCNADLLKGVTLKTESEKQP